MKGKCEYLFFTFCFRFYIEFETNNVVKKERQAYVKVRY